MESLIDSHYPKASKSFLTVKREYKHAAEHIFREARSKSQQRVPGILEQY